MEMTFDISRYGFFGPFCISSKRRIKNQPTNSDGRWITLRELIAM
ncbi:hypothetical protein [Brevibacillus laterosporus]|nr:hypothetical protein [Brevibacillus laterosporus]